ncbi:aldehyde dehydrogenase family protein [Castellaniella sp.]|uniref:aldehyde dehydrogenase family protein n=1 Tax=Castellaniella sp. TaxID=1955812 RepID=UPI003563CA51
MQERAFIYIDGQWVASAGRESIPVINPYTEVVVGHVPRGHAADADRAAQAAARAFPVWAATPPQERAAVLERVRDGLKARADELGVLITQELGMPLKLTQRIQVGSPIAIFGLYARMLAQFSFETNVAHSLIIKEPVGVVACVTPWNYPLHQIAAKVAAALAAGCTVVLKPSELTPLNAFVLADVMHEAGVPAGVFNLVSGPGAEVAEPLARHPDVDMLSFTGSTRVGRHLGALASGHLKRLSLELGGKSASLVLADADLEQAIRGTLNQCFLNSGQTCSALTRLLVPRSSKARAAELAVSMASRYVPGDPMDERTRIGPLVSDVQRRRVLDYVARGLEQGARLLCGGPQPSLAMPHGYFVLPTILGDVQPHHVVAQEEIFGPVLSILGYDDEEHAIRVANDSPYGLSGAIWSADTEHAVRVARRIRTGQLDINGAAFNILAPFGGFKQSGIGRELGQYGLDEFLELKSLQLPTVSA